MQLDHWVTTRQQQVWVNGPGGLFRSNVLLETLRGMQPDFDIGDLLITVRLMRQGHAVEYYPDLQVKTVVPRTVGALISGSAGAGSAARPKCCGRKSVNVAIGAQGQTRAL